MYKQSWRRIRLPPEQRYAHMVHMDKMSIDRIRVISWLGIVMYASLVILDYYRYRQGLFEQSPQLRLLLYIHLGGILYLLPAILTTYANAWSKHSRLSRGFVIWYMFVIMTVILFGQSLVAFTLYKSLTLFIAYVIVTNWALAMSLNQRLALNICCAIFMSIYIWYTGDLSIELLLVKLYEIVFITVIAFIFHEFDYRLQIANFMQERKLEQDKIQIEDAYTELKTAQAQLIQSEKMASLGQLTAGIAHEIQNPLNFVNNFSELNNELIEELRNERQKDTDARNEQNEDALVNSIAQNLEKINHHGKRADAIVKSMLQHSRTSSGKKEPADLNQLADEYLRLAYHGHRAKDKSFSAQFTTDFAPSLPKVEVISQDLGRVFLNLINNAFFAVMEKKRQNGDDYIPMVTLSTKLLDGRIEVRIKDNGYGIPDDVKDKIFEPFFTTKPTGQGTGLGLSLSYDIIKAHGGELKVKTEEGIGSEFVFFIPTL